MTIRFNVLFPILCIVFAALAFVFVHVKGREAQAHELPLFEPLPLLPTYKPLPLLPTYKPLPLLPTYKPLPLSPTYRPIPLSPTYKPQPLLPTYRPIPLSPTYKPQPLLPTYKPIPLSPTYRAMPMAPMPPLYGPITIPVPAPRPSILDNLPITPDPGPLPNLFDPREQREAEWHVHRMNKAVGDKMEKDYLLRCAPYNRACAQQLYGGR